MNTHTRTLLTYLSKLNTKPHELNTPVDKFDDLQLQFMHQASRCLVDYRQFNTEHFIKLHKLVNSLDLHAGNYTELLNCMRILMSLTEFSNALHIMRTINNNPALISASFKALQGIVNYYHRRHSGRKMPSCSDLLKKLFNTKTNLQMFAEYFAIAVDQNLLGNFDFTTLQTWVDLSAHAEQLYKHLNHLYRYGLHQNCAWQQLLYTHIDMLPAMLRCLEYFDKQCIYVERSIVSNFHIYYLVSADKLEALLTLLDKHNVLTTNPNRVLRLLNTNLMLQANSIDTLLKATQQLADHNLLTEKNVYRLIRNPSNIHQICQFINEQVSTDTKELSENNLIIDCMEIENPAFWQKINTQAQA